MKRFFVFAFLLVWTVSAFATVPQTINFQGQLLDSNGDPVTTQVDITFLIYADPDGNTVLWSNTRQVTPQNGAYSVNLGELAPLNLPFDQQYYLGIAVGNDPVMSPLLKLTSVGYAMRAQMVDNDQDTLADLGCAAGQVAKWSGSEWVCADETDTVLSESEVETYVTNNSINLNEGTLLNGQSITTDIVFADHTSNSWAHHRKTTSFAELADQLADNQMPATITRDSELNAHAGTSSAHHSRYTDSEARNAVTSIDGLSGGKLLTPVGIGVDPISTHGLDVEGLSRGGSFSAIDDQNSAIGLYAQATENGGLNHTGLAGYAANADENHGVNGYANTSSINFGVSGESVSGTTNHGLHGKAITGSNTVDNYGVYGDAYNNVNETAMNYGVYGVATGYNSYGVYGTANGPTAFAGYFSGNVAYTGTISDVSDRRLKENIRPLESPLSILEGIKGVYFNMKDNPEVTELGVIAQEVQAVLPEAVTVADPENGYLGVSYSSLVPVLIEAVKELKFQNEALKALVCAEHPASALCQ